MSYFDDGFFAFNHPVGMMRGEGDDKEEGAAPVYATIYMPRKVQAHELNDDPVPPEEVEDFCNRSIALLKNAIRLFEEFRDGKRNMVYYWDEDMPKEESCS